MEHDLDFLEFLGNKKTTSILRKTEDNLYLNKMSYNLNFLKDERGPQFAVKWKPTSISLQMEVYLNFCRIEDESFYMEENLWLLLGELPDMVGLSTTIF